MTRGSRFFDRRSGPRGDNEDRRSFADTRRGGAGLGGVSPLHGRQPFLTSFDARAPVPSFEFDRDTFVARFSVTSPRTHF